MTMKKDEKKYHGMNNIGKNNIGKNNIGKNSQEKINHGIHGSHGIIGGCVSRVARKLPVFMRDASKKAFTLIEVLVVIVLMVFILMVAYKVFFSQTRMIHDSMEFMKVNDDFRKIIMRLGKDFREANHISYPVLTRWEDAPNQQTPAAGGDVLKLIKQEVDPFAVYSKTPIKNWTFDKPFDLVVKVREIVYSLERDTNARNKNVPRYKLMRTEYVEELSKPGMKVKQETEVSDSLREFTVFRTLRKPMNVSNVSNKSDRIITSIPSNETGYGSELVYVRITLERQRPSEKGQVYDISLGTCFYKRGKEIFPHQ
ncbi:MAG: prepilin-type N-terminal cleavage/methylation domain-containing protein [Candidatus Riflebacteria bacterium]|nr:prepilin-type N-terminal cleavage/methylation domain-containing protein [Candidatus Riflebacteria bacterium]